MFVFVATMYLCVHTQDHRLDYRRYRLRGYNSVDRRHNRAASYVALLSLEIRSRQVREENVATVIMNSTNY